MSLSPKQKKWIHRLLWLVGIRIIVGLILYYIITFHFSELVAIAVKKETGSHYKFEAVGMKVSLFKEKLIVRDAHIYAVDSTVQKKYVDMLIPEMTIHIRDIGKLIFHKLLVIDSASIASMEIKTIHHLTDSSAYPSQHFGEVIEKMKRLKSHFSIHMLQLNNATISYTHPLINKNISIKGMDFWLEDNERIRLKLPNQDWYFPELNKRIRFQELQYSRNHLNILNPELISADSMHNPIVTAKRLYSRTFFIETREHKVSILFDTIIVEEAASSLPLYFSHNWKAYDSIPYQLLIGSIINLPWQAKLP